MDQIGSRYKQYIWQYIYFRSIRLADKIIDYFAENSEISIVIGISADLVRIFSIPKFPKFIKYDSTHLYSFLASSYIRVFKFNCVSIERVQIVFATFTASRIRQRSLINKRSKLVVRLSLCCIPNSKIEDVPRFYCIATRFFRAKPLCVCVFLRTILRKSVIESNDQKTLSSIIYILCTRCTMILFTMRIRRFANPLKLRSIFVKMKYVVRPRANIKIFLSTVLSERVFL